MRKIWFAMAIGAAAMAVSSNAHAQYNFAKKANKYQATVVPAYAPCTVPNGSTTTGALALPTCGAAVINDTVCNFDVSDPAKPAGQGSLQAVVAGKGATLDIKLQAKLQGLSAGCIGQTLCISPNVRISTAGCNPAQADGCTVLENLTNPFPSLGAGVCGVVDDKGKLQIKTTVDTSIGSDAIAGGNNVALDLARVGLRRTTGPSLPAAGAMSFSAGVGGN